MSIDELEVSVTNGSAAHREWRDSVASLRGS
jgi:hypothetical protein